MQRIWASFAINCCTTVTKGNGSLLEIERGSIYPAALSYCGITEKQYAKESGKPLYNLTMCKGNDQFSLRDNERFEIASGSYVITAEQFVKEMGLIQ